MQIIDAANEVIDSIDREELAKFFALKNDPEEEEAEVLIPFPCAFSYPCHLLLYKFSIYTKFKVKVGHRSSEVAFELHRVHFNPTVRICVV